MKSQRFTTQPFPNHPQMATPSTPVSPTGNGTYRILSILSHTFAISEQYAASEQEAYAIARANMKDTDSRGENVFVAAHIHDWFEGVYFALDTLTLDNLTAQVPLA